MNRLIKSTLFSEARPIIGSGSLNLNLPPVLLFLLPVMSPLSHAAVEPYLVGGGFQVQPEVYYSAEISDNVALMPEEYEESGVDHVFGASALYIYDSAKLQAFNTSYIEQYLYHLDGDNFLGLGTSTQAEYSAGALSTVKGDASFSLEQSERGVGRFATPSTLDEDLDEKFHTSLGLAGTYGTSDSITRLSVFSEWDFFKYLNNKSVTDLLTHHEYTVGSGIDYKISRNRYALVEFNHTILDYSSTQPEAEAKEAGITTLLFGMSWELTGKSSGSVKLGRSWKNYYKSTFSDTSGLAWNVDLDWSPREHTTLKFASRSVFEESDLPGAANQTKESKLSLENEISVFYTLEAGMSYNQREYSTNDSSESQYLYFVSLFYSPLEEAQVELTYEKLFKSVDFELPGSSLDRKMTENVFALGINYVF